MGKALSIKDTATYELVAELAAKTGVSMTQAVNEAVTSKLAEIDARRLADIAAWVGRIKNNPLPDDFEFQRDASPLQPRAGWS